MRYTTRIIVPPRVRRSGQPGVGGAYRPQVLGVRKSFGFDNIIGLATPGHLGAAALHPEIAPVFVQQSFREMEGGQQATTGALTNAMRAISHARFRPPWGADADLVKSPQDAESAALAGFTYFTLNPSELLRHGVDNLRPEVLAKELEILVQEGTLNEDWCQPYLDRTIELPGGRQLMLRLEPLRQAAVKYGRAIRHCARLSEAVARASQGRPYETEAFFGALPGPMSALDHLFIGLELESRGVRLTSLALPLVTSDDTASVQSGDASKLQARLREHVAVAEFCGPYKLSFHDVSLLPSLLPVLGDCCGDALHVKTRHLSFLEAMRVVYRTEPDLFAKIARFAGVFFNRPSGRGDDHFVQAVIWQAESDYSDVLATEQALTETTAMLLAGADKDGKLWKSQIAETLERHADIYREQITVLFDKRLLLLKAP